MAEFASQAGAGPLWFPYAQMQTLPEPLHVEEAHGVLLRLADGRELIDSIASWWCVIHGYNHPELNAAAQAQLTKLAHVMLGGLVHAPAARLAERLVEVTPEGLNHVFFSDSGSVGVEVALKMAVQYWQNRGCREKCRILALEKAYHGDTTGAMAVCDPEEGMHSLFAGLLPQQLFLPAPSCAPGGAPESVENDLARLDQTLAQHRDVLAGFILEPLLQAAGGFNMYAAEYLRGARALCEQHEVLLLFDEVATGFGRTGTLFAAEQAGVTPDIMVLGKGLTAGYLGHAATLATDRVYSAFLGADPEQALMHGPTFMGNPLACAIALASLDLFAREDVLARVRAIEAVLREELLPLRSTAIAGTRVLGACGVVEVHAAAALRGLQAFAAERGVWLRPFGRYAYTMPPYVISPDQLRAVTQVLRDWFAAL